ncbi:uncharacterized protein TNCV_2792731 [Trichonephila clavipes]|nr:uncharacterized protein TNCV_2792731 [Trichonephila clavipes]
MDTFALLRLALSDNKIKSNFGGVYASDTLPELRKHHRSFIVNTDPSHSAVQAEITCTFILLSLFTNIIECVQNAVRQHLDDSKKVVYFKILSNCEIVQFIHKEPNEDLFGYCQLHRRDPQERFQVFASNKTLFPNLLDCILTARETEADVPDCPRYQLQFGYFKIMLADEFVESLHIL